MYAKLTYTELSKQEISDMLDKWASAPQATLRQMVVVGDTVTMEFADSEAAATDKLESLKTELEKVTDKAAEVEAVEEKDAAIKLPDNRGE